ncbi:MAG: acyclic terpene utilization AtuA family protein [Bdellovibrionota bacterium]
MPRTKPLKIANAGGYWGDDPHALKRQVYGGQLDYISLDFLAEVTMSIMQKQRSRNPKMGYARDFIGMLKEVLPELLKNKTRIITNAGGINPEACAEAIEALANSLGLKVKIAIVYGDDILPHVQELEQKGASFTNMETNEQFPLIRDRLESANVYFGAAPVVEALKWEPDIIITGRVTDTGITVAPMIYEFGWSYDDWDKIAHGIIAGHMMECGCQVTGGNFSDWQKVPTYKEMGYPIAEVSPDGSFVITKHENTGGLVSVDTVREQTFYEMGNPKAYLTPDVVADFSTIKLEQAGKNRVKVFGIKGYEPTDLYKISMAYRDGYKAQGSIVISGPNARAKAEAFADIFWNRAGEDFLERDTEYYGWNACHRSLGHAEDGNEILCAWEQDPTTKINSEPLVN